MSDQFVAEVRMFGFNFAPSGWAYCNGQILPISQNTALFSVLGVNFGGNGTSNFALPNLQASFAAGAGSGAGLTPRVVGETGGEANVTLLSQQMPAHSHSLSGSITAASSTSPASAVMAPTSEAAYAIPGTALAALSNDSLSLSGGNQPHDNLQPYLALNFCIALQGIFPPRS